MSVQKNHAASEKLASDMATREEVLTDLCAGLSTFAQTHYTQHAT